MFGSGSENIAGNIRDLQHPWLLVAMATLLVKAALMGLTYKLTLHYMKLPACVNGSNLSPRGRRYKLAPAVSEIKHT